MVFNNNATHYHLGVLRLALGYLKERDRKGCLIGLSLLFLYSRRFGVSAIVTAASGALDTKPFEAMIA
jgi:hypothetical protein